MKQFSHIYRVWLGFSAHDVTRLSIPLCDETDSVQRRGTFSIRAHMSKPFWCFFVKAWPLPALLSTGYERWGDHRQRRAETQSQHNRSDGYQHHGAGKPLVICDVPRNLFGCAHARDIIADSNTGSDGGAWVVEERVRDQLRSSGIRCSFHQQEKQHLLCSV